MVWILEENMNGTRKLTRYLVNIIYCRIQEEDNQWIYSRTNSWINELICERNSNFNTFFINNNFFDLIQRYPIKSHIQLSFMILLAAKCKSQQFMINSPPPSRADCHTLQKHVAGNEKPLGGYFSSGVWLIITYRCCKSVSFFFLFLFLTWLFCLH
jgi:hypothetical protein